MTGALALAVLEATGSISDVGLVLAATRVPLALFVLVGGVAGDRLSRRRVLLACDLVRVGTQALAAVLLATGHAGLGTLAALAAVHGLAQAFFGPAATALLPEVVASGGPHRRQRAALDEPHDGRHRRGAARRRARRGRRCRNGLRARRRELSRQRGVPLARCGPTGTVELRPAGTLLRDLREGWGEFARRRWLWVGTVHVALLNALAFTGFFAFGPGGRRPRARRRRPGA